MAIVVRKDFRALSRTEKSRIVNAFLKLKSHDISTNTPSSTGGTYQKYIIWHNNLAEHRTTSFLAWHRAFLWELEEDLIAADKLLGNDGNIGIPYWRWDRHDGLPGTRRGRLWADDLMGGNGSPVTSGPFITPAWTIFEGTPLTARATGLQRELAFNSPSMPSAADIRNCLRLNSYDSSPFNTSSPNTSFRNVLEGWVVVRTGSTNLHNNGHVWVGGDMLPFTSPNDPVFFLNHSYVDLLWAQWQFRNPRLADQYPSDADIDAIGQSTGGFPAKPGMPRKLNDIMTPWDGTSGTRVWKVVDTLNFKTMGNLIPVTPPLLPPHNYTYDSFRSRNLSFR